MEYKVLTIMYYKLAIWITLTLLLFNSPYENVGRGAVALLIFLAFNPMEFRTVKTGDEDYETINKRYSKVSDSDNNSNNSRDF